MKKKFSFVAAALSVLMFAGLASCGGDKKEKNDSVPSETEYVDDTLANSSEEATTDNEEVIVAEDEMSTSGEDWDAILDEYENYCTKLASLSKKVASGDMSALNDYNSMLKSAESLQNKLDNAKDDMTAAQVARLNKIINKMATSMM